MLSIYAENPDSMACMINLESNLKFLKLFPGPVSATRLLLLPVSATMGPDTSLACWFSTKAELLPEELFFDFQTLKPE